MIYKARRILRDWGGRQFGLLVRGLALAALALTLNAAWSPDRAAAFPSCTSGPGLVVGVCGNLISNLLGSLAGDASGNDITDDVATANAGAFGGSGGTPPLNFAPVPATDPRYDRAFKALAYASPGTAGGPMPGSDLTVWGSVRGTQSNTSFANAYSGNQFNLTAGIGKWVSPDVVVGVLGGYESFDYTLGGIFGGTLKGKGGTIGAYTGWQFAPNWRFDGVLGWTGLGYDATYNGGTGSFSARRWLTSAGVTGRYNHGAAVVEPSARIYAVFEDRDAWTDNNSVSNPAQSVTTGRGSVGAKLLYPMMTGMGTVSPYVGLYGDWRFSNGSGVLTGYEAISGLSGRVVAGIGLTTPSASRFSLDAEVGGLGASYTVWSVRAQAAVPF
ncbi:hypothetical protein BH10PSE9_BH10PSE9_11470 [soil metagenome]